MSRVVLAALLPFILMIATAPAQELRQSLAAGDVSPSACGGRAALYGAGAIQVWVTRQGRMREDNPLRPLSRDVLIVLQVVVNGRSATAFGPDFENMRQGGATARLEEASGHKVVWETGMDGFPNSFRIVAEDGRVVLGPLAFTGCSDVPALAPEKPQARTRPAPREQARDAGPPVNKPWLPQGAISPRGGGGLSLPQP